MLIYVHTSQPRGVAWWQLTPSLNHEVGGLILAHGNEAHFVASRLPLRRVPATRGLVTASDGGYPGFDQKKNVHTSQKALPLKCALRIR